MDSNEFKTQRKELGWSISRTSRELGVSERTVARWQSAKNPPRIAVKFIGHLAAAKPKT